MKKFYIILKLISILLTISIIFMLISCKQAQNTTGNQQNAPSDPSMSDAPQNSKDVEADPEVSTMVTPEPTASSAQAEYYSDGFGNGAYVTVKEISQEEVVKIIEETCKTQKEEINIPVYSEDQLLLGKYKLVDGQYKCTWPGFDNRNSNFGGSFNKSAGILSTFPGGAWRDMGEGKKYLMYDTDKGTRIYIFFTADDNYKVAIGYTLYSSKKLNYADMKPLKMGQTIENVMEIDPTAQYVKVLYDRLPSGTIEDYENYWDQPITTVHLLTDGIMKFTYERSGEEENYTYTITDIEYHKNFKMQGLAGETDYSIAEIDYVD